MEKKVRFLEEEKSCVIEFQAFKDNNDKFIVKELAIVDLYSHILYHFLFKPPCSFNSLNSKARRTNRWITNYFSRINWLDGFVSYNKLDSIMYRFCSKFKTIYTNGEEKRRWIQMFTINKVENYPIDKQFILRKEVLCLAVASEKHSKSNCAIKNAYRLCEFMIDRKEKEIEGNKCTYKSDEYDDTDNDTDYTCCEKLCIQADQVENQSNENRFNGGGRHDGYKYEWGPVSPQHWCPNHLPESTHRAEYGFSTIPTVSCGTI